MLFRRWCVFSSDVVEKVGGFCVVFSGVVENTRFFECRWEGVFFSGVVKKVVCFSDVEKVGSFLVLLRRWCFF